MQGSWKEARKIDETEARAQAVLTALRVRGIAAPDAARKRILAQKDPERVMAGVRAGPTGSRAPVLADSAPGGLR